MQSNSQQRAWDREYQDPRFLSLHTQPQSSVLGFCKWLKKEGAGMLGENILQDPDRAQLRVLDLGCGNGRNLIYMADHYGAGGLGIDFSPTAIDSARELGGDLPVCFDVASIGDVEAYEGITDASIDIVLDITASNALYDAERGTYLHEVSRILRPDGVFMVRALCLDGDANAKKLIAMSPGPHEHSYILPDQLIMEKVFTEKSFRSLYGEHFEILQLKKTSGYQRWVDRVYKRRYILAYMQKK